jgi:hypothetical protein
MLVSSFSLSSYVTFVVQINVDINRQESSFIKQSVSLLGQISMVCAVSLARVLMKGERAGVVNCSKNFSY